VSREEWNALRPGDIVIERRSRTPRIVLTVSIHQPHERRPRVYISLRKLRSSWCDPCNNTVLTSYDMAARLDVAHGRRARVTDAMLWCPRHGFEHRDRARRPTSEGGSR
jgi:hypothetical protein